MYIIVKIIPNSCAEAFKSPDDVTSGSWLDTIMILKNNVTWQSRVSRRIPGKSIRRQIQTQRAGTQS